MEDASRVGSTARRVRGRCKPSPSTLSWVDTLRPFSPAQFGWQYEVTLDPAIDLALWNQVFALAFLIPQHCTGVDGWCASELCSS